MRIGILTFQFANNFGAMLQAYSLRRYLCENGVNANLINYESEFFVKTYSMNPFRQLPELKGFLSVCKKIPKYPVQNTVFKDFKKNDLLLESRAIRTYKHLVSTIKRYDAIIVGSDQVWNPELTNNDITYFAPFSDEMPCASYAAGLGSGHSLSEKQIEFFKKTLKEYKFVSVRESNSVELITPYASVPVKTAPDPVFLLTKEKWEQLSTAPSDVDLNNDYIFYYSLAGKKNGRLNEAVAAFSNKTGLRIIATHPAAKRACIKSEQTYKSGPKEFLSLINNANYVFTDSFHASAFSVLFGKQAYIVPVNPKDSRIESLLEGMGIPHSESGFYDFNAQSNNCLKYQIHGKAVLSGLLNAVDNKSEIEGTNVNERA